MGDAAFAIDLEGRILHWNRPAEEMLGHRREQVVGKKCYEVLRGIDRSGHPICRRGCDTLHQVQLGKKVPNCDLIVSTGAGKELCVNASVMVVRGNQAKPLALVHTFRDVTRHRQLEALGEQVLSSVGQFVGLSQTRPAPPQPVAATQLTSREQEVLELLTQGADFHQVAEVLCISPCTARNHIQSILSKMGVHNKVEAVVQALKYNLV